MSALRPAGKASQALRALADTTPECPASEGDVWQYCFAAGAPSHQVWRTPLAQLVQRGLAKRTGLQGGYRWHITDAGKAEIGAGS